jgi:tripartite-type tricarboxylate transporter receptor subunit TctC
VKLFTVILAGAWATMIWLPASAEAQPYPTRPIRIIATSTPGSVVDVFSRAIADPLGRALGQQIVIENRAGAGGTLAAGLALAAEPDGHTLLVNTSAHVVSHHVFTHIGFDLLRDFSGVTPLAQLPNVLVIAPQRPWKTVRELIAAAQAKPGGYSYGTGGTGTGTHMSAERFRMSAGIQAVQVPYKGTPEVLVDLIAGRIDWSLVPPSSGLPLIRDGRIRAIAIDKRNAQLPELQTFAELGMKDADFPFWVGLFVAAKVPRAVVRRLHDETVKVLQLPEVRERVERVGGETFVLQPEAFDAYLRAQAQAAGAIVKAANIRPN